MSPSITTLMVRAILDEIKAEELRELAEMLAPYLPDTSPRSDAWMESREAASYLGISTNALHKLTAARTIPFEQKVPGGKCYFKRSALDAWRAQ
jgi:excisionase family DNA binding protein